MSETASAKTFGDLKPLEKFNVEMFTDTFIKLCRNFNIVVEWSYCWVNAMSLDDGEFYWIDPLSEVTNAVSM